MTEPIHPADQGPAFLPSADHGIEEERRFGGLVRLYGAAGAARIRQAHVAVVGIGGVGSWAAEALARSGVGRLTLIDLDHIAESNINRQVHATTATLGQAKVLAMQERIAQIHPYCQVQAVEAFVEAGADGTDCLPADLDGLIDACDDMRAKVALALWAKKQRKKAIKAAPTPTDAPMEPSTELSMQIPMPMPMQANNQIGPLHFITVGAAGGKRLLQPVLVDDLARTTHDPLLAQMRYQLRKRHAFPKEGKKMGLACVYSKEAVQMPPSADACATGTTEHNLNCHGYGSVVTVTASFGMLAANWILNALAEC